MKFKTHNDEGFIDNSCGTSLIGYVNADYAALTNLFGEPTLFDDYKSDAEWILNFDDNTCATIYNYKDGVNYLGDEGKQAFEINEWHIGGRNKEVLNRLRVIFGNQGNVKTLEWQKMGDSNNSNKVKKSPPTPKQF